MSFSAVICNYKSIPNLILHSNAYFDRRFEFGITTKYEENIEPIGKLSFLPSEGMDYVCFDFPEKDCFNHIISYFDWYWQYLPVDFNKAKQYVLNEMDGKSPIFSTEFLGLLVYFDKIWGYLNKINID